MLTSVKLRANNGFTMIEVMLVLGVSSLLLLVAFIGQGAATKQARFRDAAESFRDQLVTAQQDVNNTVSASDDGCLSGNDPGTDADCINFGKIIIFNANKTSLSVRTLIAAGPGNSTGTPSPNKIVSQPRVQSSLNSTVGIRWGAQISEGDNVRIAFVRHSGTGELMTLILPTTGDLSSEQTYANGTTNPHSIYISADDDCAKLTLNDPKNSIKLDLDARGEAGC